MPTFDNGWICRECWCANRESDARCYRCHAPQPEMPSLQVDTVAKPSQFEEALGLVEAATEPEAAPPVVPAATSFCLTCGSPMDADARICSKCGTPAHELGSVVNAEPASGVTATHGEPLLPRIRKAYNAFVQAHEVEWEEAMSALAVVSALAILGASRLEGSLAEMLSTFGWLVTLLFVAEYASRLGAAEDRRRHFFTHLVDLAAIVPLLRPARVLRLVWLLLVGPMVSRVSATMGRLRGRLRPKDKAAVAPAAGFQAAVAAPIAPAMSPAAATPAASVSPAARVPKVVPQLRSHRSFTWLIPAGAAAAASSMLLLVTAEHGQPIPSLLLLVSLGLFSAITATVTTIALDRRAHAVNEQPQQLPQQLRELDQLRDAGLVTPAEHARRAELLRNLAPR